MGTLSEKIPYEVLHNSVLFDSEWYKEKYGISGDPVEHYLSIGWKVGFNPSDKFSTLRYLDLLGDDVADHEMNPLLHYELYGKSEKRLDRFWRITEECNLSGKGLEIGPSINPICPKKYGYDIEILDHTDQEGLRQKYKEHSNVASLIERIEEVDYVWKGEDYRELIGKENYYDYIIASHVIEHTTDLIGFLEQCSALLKEGGVLSLVVPDKRYDFDFFRENSNLAHVIGQHMLMNGHHSRGGVAEYFLRVVQLNQKIAWNQKILESNQDFRFVHSKEDLQKVLNAEGYVDIHEWVFTPGSFRLLMNDLHELGFLKYLYEASFCSGTENTCEFYISLKKKSVHDISEQPFNQKKRLELGLYKIQEEMDFYYRLKQAWQFDYTQD
ncbi:MAG: class I SAM-dependent methyltransferase [Eubacterium sp.]|nr:class I SAM-dependent methyltransferase [Eubacterium sp.]